MIRGDRLRPVILLAQIVFFVLLFSGGCSMPDPSERADLFSRGSGPAEILIFTDYFCPPCQAVEPYMEKALDDLFRSGMKVTFVDKPIHAVTALYSRYFLYAAKTAHRFEDMLRIRRVLFEIAKTRTVESESELLRKLKENNIRLGLFDVQPVFDQWAELIRRFGVRSTPTCIVISPGQEIVTFKGSREIPQGIDRLLQERSAVPGPK